MSILGYLGALVMGLSLGLIGGGGSILTVPILVYLFNIEAVAATGYSHFVVGLTSLAGSLTHIRQGNIEWRSALVFGIPSLIAVSLSRKFVLPLIPGDWLLLIFAVLMLLASWSMIRSEKSVVHAKSFNYTFTILAGLSVGLITGLVGAGGGFLIIPALVFLTDLSMKKAVGTSLLIIAAKSLTGFLSDLHNNTHAVNWQFLLTFSAVAIAGIVLGSMLSKHVSDEKLKPAFGWFVLTMGIWVFVKELWLK